MSNPRPSLDTTRQRSASSPASTAYLRQLRQEELAAQVLPLPAYIPKPTIIRSPPLMSPSSGSRPDSTISDGSTLADVEAYRARFLKLTQDFQRIHQELLDPVQEKSCRNSVIGEKTSAATKESPTLGVMPIELSSEEEDDDQSVSSGIDTSQTENDNTEGTTPATPDCPIPATSFESTTTEEALGPEVEDSHSTATIITARREPVAAILSRPTSSDAVTVNLPSLAERRLTSPPPRLSSLLGSPPNSRRSSRYVSPGNPPVEAPPPPPPSSFPTSSRPRQRRVSKALPPEPSSPAPTADANNGDDDYRSLKRTNTAKRRLSDLSTWASIAPLPVTPARPVNGNIPPSAWSMRSGLIQPATPAARVFEDVEMDLLSMLNPKVFRDFMRDPLGRHRFREFLMGDSGDACDFDLWLDLCYHTKQMGEVKTCAQALYDIYLGSNAQNHVPSLPQEITQDLLRTLRPYLQLGSGPGSGFETTQHHLLEKLYHNQFQKYIKHKVIQECKLQLAKQNLTEVDQEGLGDSFCLTNPRLPDHPIVLVTDGFVSLTGYPRSEVVGRNSRFLQGPGTSPQALQRIRDGLNSGEGCTELVLNYRRNGEPYYCLLCVMPLRDASGAIAYFIGGQTNVTDILRNSKNSAFLLGAGNRSSKMPPTTQNLMSPAMTRYRQVLEASRRDYVPTSSNRVPKQRAAGSRLFPDSFDPASNPDGSSPHETDPPLTPSRRLGGVPLLGRIFKKSLTSRSPQADAAIDKTQLLAEAEATPTGGVRSLEDQLCVFKDLYNQLVIFKKQRREITFVTKQLLAFVGLPRVTKRDLYCSALIHADLLAIMTGHDRAETKVIRAEVKRAVAQGETLSIPCGLKFLGRGKFGGGPKHKFGVFHMTPLKDLDNTVVAYVGIFSSS